MVVDGYNSNNVRNQGPQLLAVRLQGHLRTPVVIQQKPPPSSYKPTPSRAGGTISGGSGSTGRPQSNQGRGFSNKLTDKANELEGTKYRTALAAKSNNPEENFKKIEKEINGLLEECVSLKLSGTCEVTQGRVWTRWRRRRR